MAAFPSTSWRWIFFLLERSGIPTGLINLVKALYTQVAAHSAETRERLFWILSGILQGCPLSGSLFIIAINPLLLALRQLSPDCSRMVLTACADDIGIVLRSIELAPQIAALFDKFAALATLKLKAEKCVIVPVAIADAEAFKAQVLEYLVAQCPQWANFLFKAYSTYLGWLIGPAATPALQWKEAIEKFAKRSEQIGATSIPAVIGARLYGQRAVPVLSYLPVFGAPPETLRRTEARALHRVLHLPFNSLSLGGATHFGKHGVRNVPRGARSLRVPKSRDARGPSPELVLRSTQLR